MNSIDFVLEQQGKALQKCFDSKQEEIANKLQLDSLYTKEKDIAMHYKGKMMHTQIADWCTPLISESPLDVSLIKEKTTDEERRNIFTMMQGYWRIMNVRDKIAFHKDNNTIVLQMMCYEQTIENFGFNIYRELVQTSETQEIIWFNVLERILEEQKQAIWFYITH